MLPIELRNKEKVSVKFLEENFNNDMIGLTFEVLNSPYVNSEKETVSIVSKNTGFGILFKSKKLEKECHMYDHMILKLI